MKQGIKIQVSLDEPGSRSNLHHASKQNFCKLKPGETAIPSMRTFFCHLIKIVFFCIFVYV